MTAFVVADFHCQEPQTNHTIFIVIYCALCIIAAVIVYFHVPETKGLPIEEIGALFGDEVVVHLTADGEKIVEDLRIEDVFVEPKSE